MAIKKDINLFILTTKITLCGSIKFADKLVEVYRELEKLGHQPMPSPSKFLRNLGGQEGDFLVE